MSPPGHPREVRVAACGEYLAAQVPLKQVCEKYGVSTGSLKRWIVKAGFRTRRGYDGHVGGRRKKL